MHILQKGMQAGAVLGLAAVGPVAAYQTLYKGVAITALTPTIMKTTSRFLLGGFAATGALLVPTAPICERLCHSGAWRGTCRYPRRRRDI